MGARQAGQASVVVECRGTVWDVTAAAETLSQLAGVIGAVVFAGVIVLLSQPSKHADAGARLRALAPFIAVFVAMSLNAYVFGLIAGERGDSSRRIWTATVMASGMLAIGTVAAVCGIILLVRAYVAREDLTRGDDRPGDLEKILSVTLWLLAVVAPGLLLQRVYEYLQVWYDGNLSGLQWLWIPVILVVGASLVLVAESPALMVKPTPGPKKGLDHYEWVLKWANVLTIGYSMIGTALVGLFLGVIVTDWHHAPPAVPWTVAAFGLLVPATAIACYLYSIRGITHCTGGAEATARKP